jgi:uncharacterized membrane protein
MMPFVAALSGALAAASLVASLFFLRFWRTTGDRFFLYFSLSFALEALDRIVLSVIFGDGEARPAVYLIRLLAYLLILLAIAGKNRRRKPAAH